MTNKIYIASSLHNSDRVKGFIKLFESYGAEITHDWTTHGKVTTTEELRLYGEKELDGVISANVLFFVHPGRFGAHVELGAALALIRVKDDIPAQPTKHVVILEEDEVEEQKPFYHLDFIHKFNDEKQAIEFTLEIMGLK